MKLEGKIRGVVLGLLWPRVCGVSKIWAEGAGDGLDSGQASIDVDVAVLLAGDQELVCSPVCLQCPYHGQVMW